MKMLLLISNFPESLENWMFSGCSRAMGSEREGGRMVTHAPARDLGIDTKQLH
jgi:hypothetical protein